VVHWASFAFWLPDSYEQSYNPVSVLQRYIFCAALSRNEGEKGHLIQDKGNDA